MEMAHRLLDCAVLAIRYDGTRRRLGARLSRPEAELLAAHVYGKFAAVLIVPSCRHRLRGRRSRDRTG